MTKTRNKLNLGAEFLVLQAAKSGKNKAKKRWIRVFKCTVAERDAIIAHCELYPPDTPLDEVKKRVLNIGGIHDKIQMLIDVGVTKVGDVIG